MSGRFASSLSLVTFTVSQQVYATATSHLQQLGEAGVKDSAHCMITFPSGAVFTMEMTRCSAYGYDNRIEVMFVYGWVGG